MVNGYIYDSAVTTSAAWSGTDVS